MKWLGYAFLAVATVATLVLLHALTPNTVSAAVLLGGWLLLPYALLAAALHFLTNNPASLRTYTTMALATPTGGLVFLVYVIYLQPDAQGAIAVLFTPLYQLVGVVLLFPVCEWLFGKRRAN